MGGISTGMAIGAALAALVGGGAGWMARGLVVDHIETPRVIEQQVEICTLTTEAVAAKATRDEQLRQFQIAERATQTFIEQSQLAADDAQAARDLLEMEIKENEQRRRGQAGEGRLDCGLDAADLELLGVRTEQGGALSSGGRARARPD
ncbi:hypothetical protein PSC71_13295 [Devosia sp. J2-20]|uniref:hypothetical protein n=1 Tax=Devosia sp. J2-20 TaxID=3026161 RepID=UPI00249AEB87|nr:hypothetical protein [Devosia sp. J2-20]WDQ98204.1 hypothetical protein PSC71_13295 [Devosia sp. J2-20]